MWAQCKTGLLLAGIPALLAGQQTFAQDTSKIPSPKLSNDILTVIGMPPSKQTPIHIVSLPKGLPIKLLYDGPKLSGEFTLIITVSKRNRTSSSSHSRPVSQSTLHLTNLGPETDAVLSLPDSTDNLQIKAVLRDENQNLVLETAYPLPIISNNLRILELTSVNPPELTPTPIPDFTGIEIIKGNITLPRKATLPENSIIHVQLLENALAGGLSLQLAAQDARPAIITDGAIPFTLERGTWDQRNDPDLAFKVWISDSQGRKIFVMSKPVSYNGPDIDYTIPLDSLKQGKETKRGRHLNPDLMAQTLVQGEAEFDPINGIPGEARLQIKLRQDRGDFNRNPILAEQTLLLRGMETRIPFSLTTDSTHFDPYAPAPFLSVSLTDSYGRVHYQSGEIRAREGQNSIRLYPR